MLTKELTSKQLEILKNNVYAEGIDSTIFIDPENEDHLLKIYSQALLAKGSSYESLLATSEIQPQIKHTSLPLGAVFVDGQFEGSILKFHKKNYPTSKFSSLPIRTQIEILRNLVRNIKELSDNYIYHLDLDRVGYTHYRPEYSSILITRTGEANIVSLDGNSVSYSPNYNPTLELLVRSKTNEVVGKLLRQSQETREYFMFWKKENDAKRKEIERLIGNVLDYEAVQDVIERVLTRK